MQATLIYNGSAGGAESYSSQDIKDALTDAGYNVHYYPTHNEKDVASVLADAEGLVVIAGGDGTVRTVMLHYMQQRKTLAEHADTEQDNHQHLTHPPRLSIIPLGTANNISRALGIKGNLDSMLTGLEQPQTCRFDVGCLAAPWGSRASVAASLQTHSLGMTPNRARVSGGLPISLLTSFKTINLNPSVPTLTDATYQAMS